MRVYRASGLGGCIKAQVAAQLGFRALDTEKKMENMAREGALHEGAVLRRLEEEGYEVQDRQREVWLEVLPSVQILGHLDATTYDKDNNYIIEVKSMAPDLFREYKEKSWAMPGFMQKYLWQVSCYMHAMPGYVCMFVVKNRSSGEMRVEPVVEPFYTMDQVMARVLEIEKWVRRGELPDECSVSQWPCPYYYLEQQKTLEIMEDAVLDDLCEMLEEARVAEKAAKERVKVARMTIDESLGERDRVETEKNKVTRYDIKRKMLDVEKMKGDGVEVDKYYRETLSKGVRVTVKGGTDENEPGGDTGGTATDREAVHEHRD